MRKKLIFATDLDRVVIDTVDLFIKGFKKYKNIDITENLNGIYIVNAGLSEKEIRETIENILILDSIYAKPIELSIESLEKIYKLLNNKILFVSNRSEKIRKQTEDWLNLHIRNKFDYELILGDGSILSDKKDRLKGVHFYVDDAIEHVFSASKNIDSIINCFLFESKNVVYDYFRTVNDYTIRKLFKQNKIIRTTNWKIIVKHIEALFSTNKLTI